MSVNIFDQFSEQPQNSNPPDVKARESIATDSVIDGASADSANTTDKQIKDATQELLRRGHIEESHKPVIFRNACTHERKLQTVLEPLDLSLRLDTHRGVAWLTVAKTDDESKEEDAWSHPLVRRQRLTLEQSLLIALLRQAFMLHEQNDGVGQSPAKIAIEELLPQFLTYFEDSGSDQKNESRLLSLLDQLKTYAIVSEVDKNHEVTIRPMIVHLANPESLSALLQSLKAQVQTEGAGNE